MLLGEYLAVRGLDLVRQAHGMDASALQAAGATPRQAASLLGLHAAYFGETKFSGRQRAARTAAGRHSLDTLERIESWVGRVKKQRDKWALRVALAQAAPEQLDAVARQQLRRLAPCRPPAPGVRLTRRKAGPHTLSITDDSLAIADLRAMLAARDSDLLAAARSLVDAAAPAGAAAAFDAAAASLTDPHATVPLGGGVTMVTNVNITLDELVRIVHDADSSDGGLNEVVLETTGGARVTGAQLIERTLASYGLVTLVHPLEGPINAYRTARVANEKQRTMISALYTSCVWPSCNCPVDEAQFHHVVEYADGGDTNVANMVPLCPYHNGVNGHRGRIEFVGRRPQWVPAWAHAPTDPPRAPL